jgi:YhcH/YjgK/YiaL family protein
MIYDFLANAETYRHVKPGIATALEYLRKTDFTDVPNGKYELDGGNVYALVQRYQTKPLAGSVWESHRKFIDVQFVFRGEERFGYVPLNQAPAVTQSYDDKTDALLYAPGAMTLPLKAGQFVVFYPQDIHGPCLAENDVPSAVIKVVVKVAV